MKKRPEIPESPLERMRREYEGRTLTRASVDPDPIRQFNRWFQDELEAGNTEPNAMSLATATPQGRPSVRIVLLKAVDEAGFVFYTNYESRKGIELAANPHATALIYWPNLNRQVRIEGMAGKVSREESVVYFNQRPRPSRLAALVSAQSQAVESRRVLEAKMKEAEELFAGDEIPAPENWGGYRIVPYAIEFWQGRENRLHDRLLYTRRDDGSWPIERLAP